MYTNRGDKNFLEHGILVDNDHSDTEIQILFCNPYPEPDENGERIYQSGHCLVDITSDWIDKKEVMSFIGMTDDTFDPVEYAIGCLEYYGAAEFGVYDYMCFVDWTRMHKDDIEKMLRGYLIAWDDLVLEE